MTLWMNSVGSSPADAGWVDVGYIRDDFNVSFAMPEPEPVTVKAVTEALATLPRRVPTRPVLPKADVLPIGSSYFEQAFDFDELIARARIILARVDFDTIAVTGVSGTIAGTVLAQAFGKHLFVVRKADDNSTHSSLRFQGYLGKRWLFVDDLVSSGRTRRHVAQGVTNAVQHGYRVKSMYHEGVAMDTSDFTTDYVGTYLYAVDHLDEVADDYLPGRFLRPDDLEGRIDEGARY